MRVKNDVVVASQDEIIAIETGHGVGTKKVLITNNQCESPLMQAAIGELKFGDKVEIHQHSTMEEFYFINEGFGVFIIDNIEFIFKRGSFVKIPAGALHGMEAKTNLHFIYWGVAI